MPACACPASCHCDLQQQQLQSHPQPQYGDLAATLPRSSPPAPMHYVGGGRPNCQSYDEFDPDSEYGFQRKRRFGLKNGSDAVRVCLEQPAWQARELQQRAALNPPADDVGMFVQVDGSVSTRRYRSEGARRAEETFEKIGHPLADPLTIAQQALEKAYEGKLAQLQRKLTAQQVELQRTQEAANRMAAEAARALQQKQLLQQQHQLQQQIQQLQLGQPAQPRSAWQQQSLQSVLDGDDPAVYAAQARLNVAQQQQLQFQQYLAQQQMQQAQQAQQAFHQPMNAWQSSDAEHEEKAVQVPSRSPSEAQLLQQQQQQPASHHSTPQKQLDQQRSTSANASRTSSSSKQPNGATARSAAAHVASEPHAAAAAPPAESGTKAGLGNTLLGSPHDPRDLHDPESLDIVWRRREEARQRAKRLHAALGLNDPAAQAAHGEADAEAARQSEMKQMSRRVKIQAFERRHTEERLSKCTTPFTREMPDGWMSQVVGKPPFAAFGNGNTAPATGGLIYGDYMLSHNVSPEKKRNNPNAKQVTEAARRVAETKKKQASTTLRRLLRQSESDPTKREERALLWQAAEGLRMDGTSTGGARSARGSSARPKSAGPHSRRTASNVSTMSPAAPSAAAAAAAAPNAVASNQVAAEQRALASSYPLSHSPRIVNGAGVYPTSQAAQNGNARNIGGGALSDPSSWALVQAGTAPPKSLESPVQPHQQYVPLAQAPGVAQGTHQSPQLAQQYGQNLSGSPAAPQATADMMNGWRGGFSDSRSPVTAELSRSQRRHDYPGEQVIGGSNTLAETTARTMSVLPLPEKQVQMTPSKQQVQLAA